MKLPPINWKNLSKGFDPLKSEVHLVSKVIIQCIDFTNEPSRNGITYPAIGNGALGAKLDVLRIKFAHEFKVSMQIPSIVAFHQGFTAFITTKPPLHDPVTYTATGSRIDSVIVNYKLSDSGVKKVKVSYHRSVYGFHICNLFKIELKAHTHAFASGILL